jgi:hypothetical protein
VIADISYDQVMGTTPATSRSRSTSLMSCIGQIARRYRERSAASSSSISLGLLVGRYEVRSGNIKRLIITLPPRHLKSITTSVAFPAFVLGNDPSKKIIALNDEK